MAPVPAQAQLNPCPYIGDGDCDEPNGLNLCAWGTDATDCSNPNSNFGSGAGFSAGAYTSGGGGTATPQNTCAYTNDGDCDEPNGLNLCAWGTDAADCSNPNSNFGSGAGFSAGAYSAPAAPAPTPGGGNFIGGGSSGSFVNSGGGGGFGCPNYATQSTAFGQGTLNAGGALNPVRIPRITAGGRHALANCFPGTGWRGYTITRPDYRFFYQGQSPTGRLSFSLVSSATDTVLLINTPDGQWHFNDDSNGSYNSTLTFSPPLQGQYDIWAGSYNLSSNNAAQLWISE
ncbi:MAG: hypothetical protein JKY00_13845 [Roseicyclus sp.]|nr:hypothetical protein [Roseicyclus sp.]